MIANKPTPLCFRPPPPKCPVCGMSSYSAAGVHPQCCTRQLDAERIRKIKAAAQAYAEAHPPSPSPAAKRSMRPYRPPRPATARP
jgi:hypothetical protein